MKALDSTTEDRGPEGERIAELTLRIAERANRLAQERGMPPGCELALWLEAEAQVKRELRASGRKDAPRVSALRESSKSPRA